MMGISWRLDIWEGFILREMGGVRNSASGEERAHVPMAPTYEILHSLDSTSVHRYALVAGAVLL